jgi:hypothetical protein
LHALDALAHEHTARTALLTSMAVTTPLAMIGDTLLRVFSTAFSSALASLVVLWISRRFALPPPPPAAAPASPPSAPAAPGAANTPTAPAAGAAGAPGGAQPPPTENDR